MTKFVRFKMDDPFLLSTFPENLPKTQIFWRPAFYCLPHARSGSTTTSAHTATLESFIVQQVFVSIRLQKLPAGTSDGLL